MSEKKKEIPLQLPTCPTCGKSTWGSHVVESYRCPAGCTGRTERTLTHTYEED